MDSIVERSSSSFLPRFIANVHTALCSCGFNPDDIAAEKKSIGAAVSGGADSVSLLVSLAYIAKDAGIPLHVITVNHNIRQAEETAGDAAYVQQLCVRFAAYGCPVDCTLRELAPGEVASAARLRGNGTEEAARFLRYKKFDEFAQEKDVACICLAHNRNDQLETLLMRFLQGSSGISSAGIQQVRGLFVRPLLNIPRSDIERFLIEQHISWRTDSTNNDTRYLRNRIRHIIMPELDRTVPGWQKAVLAGGKKAAETDEVVAGETDGIKWNISGQSVFMPLYVFTSQKKAVQIRLLYTALGLIGCGRRVPYSFIERMCSISSVQTEFRGNAFGFAVCAKNGSIFVEKEEKPATDSGFSAIIEETGSYELPCGTVTVDRREGEYVCILAEGNESAAIEEVKLPFCIRSRQPGDEVKTASGGMRSVSDILSDWKVNEEDRERVPVIQELAFPEQQIVCLWGSIYGYDDWIVLHQEK
jgi:tRNA(Ile)-lysidine synthase